MKILIVDDKFEERYLLETILKGKGYEVISAGNGMEALEKMREGGISIIISDILMPVMDGFQLCKEVRTDEKMKDTPFVFYTATYTDERDEELAMKIGADKFIRKPAEIEDFVKEIENVLKNAEQKRIEAKKPEAEEIEVMKLYSERLIKKLENKMIQLRKLSEKLKLIFENVNDIIYFLDENGCVKEVNRRVERLGYKKEELIGKNFKEFLTPESQKIAMEYFEKAKRERKIQEDIYEVEVLRKDGGVSIIEVNCFTLFENGKFIGRFGIGRDVTERKKIEKALQKSEEMYRLIAENVSDAIFTLDMNLKFTYVSPLIKKMRGFTVEETLSQSIEEVLTPQSYALAMKAFQEELAEESNLSKDLFRTRTLELEITCKDGSTIWTETKLSFLRDSEGNPIGILGVSRDITERKKAESERKVLEEKYSRLFEESKTAIFITSPNGKFIDVNPAGIELLGYSSKEELLQKNYLDHYSVPEEIKIRQKILEEKDYLEDFELKMKKKNGREITVLETTSAVRDSEGKVLAYRGILRDITAYKRMEAQILQSQKLEAIGRLAGGVAHDFNNLLTAIIGNAEMLLLNIPKDNPQIEKVKTIMDTALRAGQLTRQLLAFGKKQVSFPKLVNLNDLIFEMKGMLERILGEDIKFETELASSIFPVEVDPTHIEQVVLNLAVNSREAMLSGGKLIISTKNVYLDEDYCRAYPALIPGDYVLLSVSDTGVGMSKEVLEHIFEPFFSTKESGTGMGLSIVYGIIKQYEGHITVYSEPGAGTTFKIYLPALKKLISKENEITHEEQIVGGDETILVVEDERDVRELMEIVLGELGYKVYSASNRMEAVELMKKLGKEINLLISDIVLPDGRGHELAREFMIEYPGLKILLTSGYPDEMISTGREHKINFLSKPFTPKNLARKIREILEKK